MLGLTRTKHQDLKSIFWVAGPQTLAALLHVDTPEGIRTQPESASGSKFSALTDDFRENTRVVVLCIGFSAVFGGFGVIWTPPSAPPYLTMYITTYSSISKVAKMMVKITKTTHMPGQACLPRHAWPGMPGQACLAQPVLRIGVNSKPVLTRIKISVNS